MIQLYNHLPNEKFPCVEIEHDFKLKNISKKPIKGQYKIYSILTK